MNASSITKMPPRELAHALRDGAPVDVDRLAGADFRGVSLGLPRIVERLTWKTFKKSFRRADDGGVSGFNVKVEGRRGTFGPYRVRAPHSDRECPFECPRGVILDYRPTHPTWHPMATVRDVLVAVDDSQNLFLGAMYLELAGVRVRTPSFFTLERE
jgi:hypothetical protein